MLLQRLHPPQLSNSTQLRLHKNYQRPLAEILAQTIINLQTLGLSLVRHASHNQQSSHHQKKDGPGKRLGAKKSGEEYVIPGNIIFRQRGTHWFPGENVGMGRDHTIFSKVHGYVKYYRDPMKHPKRQYIGVALERHHVLPYNPTMPRHRRLNMVAEKMDEEELKKMIMPRNIERENKFTRRKNLNVRPNLTLRPGYMYRESNWEIGRAAEKAKIVVPRFKPRDRWTAWRKSVQRRLKNAEKRAGLRKKPKMKAKAKLKIA